MGCFTILYYKESISLKEENYKELSCDDGGLSGPTYVVYEKKWLLD